MRAMVVNNWGDSFKLENRSDPEPGPGEAVMKVRAAGWPHLAAIKELCQGHMLADVVTILSSMDIVLGEIDR